MKLKSYFANSVEDAMAMAREELGLEAMLVNSRKAAIEARHLGAYEVVFASEVEPAVPSEPPEQKPANDRFSRQMAEMMKELEDMRRTITRSVLPPAAWRDSYPDRQDAYAALTAAEVSPDLAREIVMAAESRVGKPILAKIRAVPGRATIRGALIEELESRFQVQPMLGRSEARPRIVALVGPPGCGKTTTLVKLAVNYGLAASRPVMLLSMDTYRIAAAEQLRSYAAILGVGFQVVETVTALAQAIEENRGKELIFIDTPGMGPAELPDFAPLAQFLSTRQDIDTQLAVSSSMKSADLSRVVDSFEVFQPQRMIFTRMDETGSFGPILNEAVRTGKPLSFFTTGQRIPEDMEAATKGRLVQSILGSSGERAISAA